MAETRKEDYVDAVRGWAIILVITCHVGNSFTEMPYPIRQVTNFGSHGVQLFFLASAVTLLLSWRAQKDINYESVWKFFIRRFLRIAPMYYFGAALYFYFDPPTTGFDLGQALRTLLFVNAWHPDWIPTTPGWTVVPGGWSIGVEFTFYAIFPVLAFVFTGFIRIAFLVLASIVVAIFMNVIGANLLSDYPKVATDSFLYFWFFNQSPVFALGFVLHFALSRTQIVINHRGIAYISLAATLGTWFFLARHVSAYRFSPGAFPPNILLATLSFMVFIFILARSPNTLFTHPLIRRIGVLSFGCYVLHFLFLQKLLEWSGGLIDPQASGYAAIGAAATLWLATMVCTTVAASLAHTVIEKPGIALAHRLTSAPARTARVSEAIGSTGRV